MKLRVETSKGVKLAACVAAVALASTASAAFATTPPKSQPKLTIAFGVAPNTNACSLIAKNAISFVVNDPGGSYPCSSRSGATVNLSLGGLTSYVPVLPSVGSSRIFTATGGTIHSTPDDPRGYFLLKVVLYSSPAIVTGIEQNVSAVAAENSWKTAVSNNFDAGYVMPSRTSKAFPGLPNDKREVTVSGYVFAKGPYIVFLVAMTKAAEAPPYGNFLSAEANVIAKEL